MAAWRTGLLKRHEPTSLPSVISYAKFLTYPSTWSRLYCHLTGIRPSTLLGSPSPEVSHQLLGRKPWVIGWPTRWLIRSLSQTVQYSCSPPLACNSRLHGISMAYRKQSGTCRLLRRDLKPLVSLVNRPTSKAESGRAVLHAANIRERERRYLLHISNVHRALSLHSECLSMKCHAMG